MFDSDDAPHAIRASYAVLFAVGGAGPAGTTVNDISRATGLNSRTVYRHLRSLRSMGLVEPAAQHGRFQIGAATADLAVRTADQRTFLKYAQEAADEVSELAREPAHVTVYDHGTSATVATASDAALRTSRSVPITLGSRRPAHASASGKVFLAFNESARAAYLLRPLQSFTRYTVTDPDRLIAHCRTIREQGYSVDIQENTMGVSCLAVPVRGTRGRVHASIVISTGRPDMDPAAQRRLLEVLRPAAAELGRKVGG